MDRLEIVTFALWGAGIAVLTAALCSIGIESWRLSVGLAVVGLVLLGLGGVRPLGAFLWHGIAEAQEIGKEAEGAGKE